MGILYVLLGALALVFAYLLIRIVVRSVPHIILIGSEYLWHNLLVLLFCLIVVGLFAALFLLIL